MSWTCPDKTCARVNDDAACWCETCSEPRPGYVQHLDNMSLTEWQIAGRPMEPEKPKREEPTE